MAFQCDRTAVGPLKRSACTPSGRGVAEHAFLSLHEARGQIHDIAENGIFLAAFVAVDAAQRRSAGDADGYAERRPSATAGGISQAALLARAASSSWVQPGVPNKPSITILSPSCWTCSNSSAEPCEDLLDENSARNLCDARVRPHSSESDTKTAQTNRASASQTVSLCAMRSATAAGKYDATRDPGRWSGACSSDGEDAPGSPVRSRTPGQVDAGGTENVAQEARRTVDSASIPTVPDQDLLRPGAAPAPARRQGCGAFLS